MLFFMFTLSLNLVNNKTKFSYTKTYNSHIKTKAMLKQMQVVLNDFSTS